MLLRRMKSTLGTYKLDGLVYVRPVFVADAKGMVVWEASYLPFGGVQSSTGGPDLRFPGQWFQAESGLYQNWMRDYDPTLGRYLQADPLGLVDGASVYGYALQNPNKYVDPKGESITDGFCAIPTLRPLCQSFETLQKELSNSTCEPDCGPFTNPQARYAAELRAGISELEAEGVICVREPTGEIWCPCPGKPMLNAELRHDQPHFHLPSSEGHPAHHDCPHWYWRNCDGRSGNITHQPY